MKQKARYKILYLNFSKNLLMNLNGEDMDMEIIVFKNRFV